MNVSSRAAFACGLVAAATVFVADDARACGGLFCSNASPTPVDQSAERILFEVNDDGSVTATVEIRYDGDPRDFSWIVPVSGTPDFVEVATKDELLLLDTATVPTFIPPTQVCSNPPASFPSSGPGFACEEALSSLPVADNDAIGGGVEVTNYPSVGPFDDIVVVEGNDPGVLVAWLNDNGYRVTDAMRPFIEEYTVEGYKFLATKLQSSADVRDMVPIRFHCPQPFPEIPLRLTAIAAEPEMGFLVFVAGNRRYMPANYDEVALDPADLRIAPDGTTNYFALLSHRLDEAGGLGFVVERAEPNTSIQSRVENTFLNTPDEQAARIAVSELLQRRPYLTRLYSRLDPDEMLADPQFIENPNSVDFSAFDLSSQTVDNCPGADDPPPVFTAPVCGALYCGLGDSCAATGDGTQGCVCSGARTARAITAPGGGSQVVCTSNLVDLHGGPGRDACAGVTCGQGTCVAVNDRPTCNCEIGTVAVVREGAVRCEPISGRAIAPDALLWPVPEAVVASGCGAQWGKRGLDAQRIGGWVPLAALLGVLVALRRLRR